jgi:hypothetical protein
MAGMRSACNTARAAEAGVSLADFLRGELSRIARRPSLEAFLARLENEEPVPDGPATSQLLEEARRA